MNIYIYILRALLQHGADVNTVDNNDTTALHRAVLANRTDGIDALVGTGPDLEPRRLPPGSLFSSPQTTESGKLFTPF